jgi:hypothetical protein
MRADKSGGYVEAGAGGGEGAWSQGRKVSQERLGARSGMHVSWKSV